MTYSSDKTSINIIEEIKSALHDVNFGSIEIFIQNGIVTQITQRNIKKLSQDVTDFPKKKLAKVKK